MDAVEEKAHAPLPESTDQSAAGPSASTRSQTSGLSWQHAPVIMKVENNVYHIQADHSAIVLRDALKSTFNVGPRSPGKEQARTPSGQSTAPSAKPWSGASAQTPGTAKPAGPSRSRKSAQTPGTAKPAGPSRSRKSAQTPGTAKPAGPSRSRKSGGSGHGKRGIVLIKDIKRNPSWLEGGRFNWGIKIWSRGKPKEPKQGESGIFYFHCSVKDCSVKDRRGSNRPVRMVFFLPTMENCKEVHTSIRKSRSKSPVCLRKLKPNKPIIVDGSISLIFDKDSTIRKAPKAACKPGPKTA